MQILVSKPNRIILLRFGGPEEDRWVSDSGDLWRLASESVEGTSLAFQGVDDVHGGDGLPLGVFAVGDCVTDDILQENLEDTAGFFVDQARDTLDSTSASQSADGGFGDSLDVITQDLAMSLRSSLSQTFSSLSTSRHADSESKLRRNSKQKNL